MIAVFSNINRSDKLEIKGTEEKKKNVWCELINVTYIGKHVLLGSVITCDYVNALVSMHSDKSLSLSGIFIIFIANTGMNINREYFELIIRAICLW